MNQLASAGIAPDLTFLLTCPVEVALSRALQRIDRQTSDGRREDRFESEDLEFHERVRKGFLELAQAEPRRFVTLDASTPILEIHEEIKKIVDQKLRKP